VTSSNCFEAESFGGSFSSINFLGLGDLGFAAEWIFEANRQGMDISGIYIRASSGTTNYCYISVITSCSPSEISPALTPSRNQIVSDLKY
jgi:hypothetical protein